MIEWQQQVIPVQTANYFLGGVRLSTDAQGVWAAAGSNDNTLIDMFGLGGKADLAGAVSWGLSAQIQSDNGWQTGISPSIGLYRLGVVPPGSAFSGNPFGGVVEAMLMVWAYGDKLMYVAGVNNINGLAPQQYDTGAAPCVCLDAYATNQSAIPIVEVHQGSNDNSQLWYRIGYINAGPVKESDPFATPIKVSWSKSSYRISGKAFGNAHGTAPSVVVAGGYVLVVFEGSKGTKGNLWYDLGKLNGDTIDWMTQENYSNGQTPSIGLTPTYFGQPYQNPSSIVETHSDSTGGVTYRTGTWNNQSSPTAIEWIGGDTVWSTNACQPSVALDENSAAGFIWLPQCNADDNVGWGLAYEY
jgi:hypothetical protein